MLVHGETERESERQETTLTKKWLNCAFDSLF